MRDGDQGLSPAILQREAGARCLVWCLRTERRSPDETACDLALLSAEERARHDDLVFARDRRDYAAAHALVRASLSHWAGGPPEAWRFTGGRHEKPRLARDRPETAGLSFNASHSRGLVACAITVGAEVGIDVERIDRVADVRDLAVRVFSPPEVRELEDAPPAARATRFAELWTLKEAFLKTLGVGLAMSLSAMSFDLRQPGTVRFAPPPGLAAGPWHFAVFSPTAEHVMSVALAADLAPSPLAPSPVRWLTARWAGAPSDDSFLSPDRLS